MSDSVSRQKEPTSCKRCLWIDEIFQHILSHLHDLGKNGRSVASLSETCRSFRDAALPVLWSDLDSLVPLIKLLPPHTWHEVVDQHGTRHLELQSIETLDLTRVAQYAQFVKFFTWSYNEDVSITSLARVFSQILRLREHLFPNLRGISWREDRKELFPYLSMMTGPGLLALRLDGSPEDHEMVAGVFSDIKTHCTELGLLDAINILDEPKIINALAEIMLSGVDSLLLVNTDYYLDSDGVCALAQMPQLDTARVRIDSHALHGLVLPSARPNFSVLGALKVDLEVLDEGSLKLIQAIQSPKLETIVLRVASQPWNTDVLKEHLEALVQAPFSKVLQHLNLAFDRYFDDDIELPEDDAGVTGDTLNSLLRLPSLVEINLSLARLSIDVPFLSVLARTYPNLEILNLSPTTADCGCVPLEALVHFAQHCPNLEALGLRVDALHAPDAPSRVLPSMWPRLEALFVADSPVADPERVTAFLLAVFPRLSSVHYIERRMFLPMFTLEQVDAEEERIQMWHQVDVAVWMEALVRDVQEDDDR
ncbi:hypothetical protein B0H21DRAFT_757902 [Amylocystis lapponica]|nr:hypothetical protein B0H21DRAFT_757902 [Amylocystis lapponica]